MTFKAQVAIDIVIRNLFERTADIGFLATDDDIRSFLNNYKSKYDEQSNQSKDLIVDRFKEYVAKYSVYFDIVLSDTKGNILVRLDQNSKVEKVESDYIQMVLNTSDEYVETYKFHDFIPQYKKSLVYSYKVTKTNSSSSENIGVLSLCFRFTDEMKGIFNNLVDPSNKECMTILDESGCVIASSDKYHIPLGVELPIILNEEYKIVSFAGRDYIAKSCETNGYQGFMGLKWYGHMMIPLEYAFLSDISNESIGNQNVIDAMMDNKVHFPKELKDVFNKSKSIQENLKRVIWNGNIVQSKLNSVNKEFSKSLLAEIGVTGTKANSSLSNLNETILSSILTESKFLSSLAIDIMDRNLYERANDCRWWALTSYFREAFDDKNSIISKKDEITSILKYINDLYTVYTNLLVFDKDGKVIAVSNEKEEYLVGKVLTQEWVSNTLQLNDTSKYCVSKFEKTPLYGNEPTYIYCSAIRSFKNEKQINGGIAIVFDSSFQFHAMLDETLPKDSDKNNLEGVFAFFTNRDKKIISSTNDEFIVDDYLDIEDKFFEVENGGKYSEIIEFKGSYYAVGVRCSTGYREYKSVIDDYKNDVICLVFIKIGSVENSNNVLSNKNNTFTNHQTEAKNLTSESMELATFNIGSKFLAVDAKNVLESISKDELEESIEMEKNNPFKGMVLYKDKLVSVLDIRDFINVDISDDELNNIILFEYDKDNVEHCVGILVSTLQSISVVEKDSIQHIENHFLGSGTLVRSIVDITENNESKVAMILDIKKIDDNLTKKV
jgi:chemotaxis signal transduction protein